MDENGVWCYHCRPKADLYLTTPSWNFLSTLLSFSSWFCDSHGVVVPMIITGLTFFTAQAVNSSCTHTKVPGQIHGLNKTQGNESFKTWTANFFLLQDTQHPSVSTFSTSLNKLTFVSKKHDLSLGTSGQDSEWNSYSGSTPKDKKEQCDFYSDLLSVSQDQTLKTWWLDKSLDVLGPEYIRSLNRAKQTDGVYHLLSHWCSF